MILKSCSVLKLAIGAFLLGGLAQCQPSATMNPGSPDTTSSVVPVDPSLPEVAKLVEVPGWNLHEGLSGFAIWGTAQNDVWLGGMEGRLSHFDGSTWSRVPSPTKFCIRGLSGSSSSDVWAVASESCPFLPDSTLSSSKTSEILHWDGTAWSRVVSRDGELTVVAASGPDDVWAAGFKLTKNFVMHWDGTSWQELAIPLQHTPTSMWSRASNDVWMVSSYVGSGPFTDRIQHWDGTKWQGVSLPTYPEWQCGVWSSGPNDVWSQGMRGGWRFDGAAWSTRGLPLQMKTLSTCAIWGSGPDDVWIGGGETLAHWNGTRLQIDSLSPSYTTGIWGSGPKDIWLASFGNLYHYYQP